MDGAGRLKEGTREAHLVKRPRVGEAAVKHLVHQALGLFPALAVRVGGHREDGPPPDARLMLLRERPIPPCELAPEPTVAAQVLRTDLFIRFSRE